MQLITVTSPDNIEAKALVLCNTEHGRIAFYDGFIVRLNPDARIVEYYGTAEALLAKLSEW